MTTRPALPTRDDLLICFAHVAYCFGERFALRQTGLRYFTIRTLDALSGRIAEPDVLVVSGLWRNEFVPRAAKLVFIQSISAGIEQYSCAALAARGIRLASAQGVNARAVAEHAIALILALVRQLPIARDHQMRCRWRGLSSQISSREDELGGKTLLIIGLGRIGSRLAELARAFGMRVIATKRDPTVGASAADWVVGHERLFELLPQADVVALTCPLTPQTDSLIGPQAFALMKPSAYLINVARGRVVDEVALLAALDENRIAGAGLDCFWAEPLPASSPLWAHPNVLITPHAAGETRRYEDNVIDLLLDNLDRLWRGERELRNGVV